MCLNVATATRTTLFLLLGLLWRQAGPWTLCTLRSHHGGVLGRGWSGRRIPSHRLVARTQPVHFSHSRRGSGGILAILCTATPPQQAGTQTGQGKTGVLHLPQPARRGQGSNLNVNPEACLTDNLPPVIAEVLRQHKPILGCSGPFSASHRNPGRNGWWLTHWQAEALGRHVVVCRLQLLPQLPLGQVCQRHH